MNDLRSLLKRDDPLAGEPPLTVAEIEHMRRVVTMGRFQQPSGWWPGPAMVVVTIAATLVAGVAIGRRLPATRPPVSAPGSAMRDTVRPEPIHRQLQFATPGGTRIIWVFSSDFTL